MEINSKAKIRIAHIAGGLTSGGVEGVIYNYFSAIEDKSDYELVYITYDTPNPVVQKRFENIGFTVYCVTKKYDNFIKSCKEVAQILKKHNINIVHSHMTLMSFITSFIGKWCGAKATIAHSHLAQEPTGIKRIVYSIFKWLSKCSSDYWFACGNQAGEYLFGNRAMNSGRVRVLNNAVFPELFEYNENVSNEIRTLNNINEKVCVGHIGRYTEQKNHSFLIDIFQELHILRPDCALLLLGDGPLMEKTRQKVKDLNLTESVIFTGSVEDPGRYYSAMDIMLLPSLYEGLAVVLVESQFAGLPVLVSTTVTQEIDIAGNLSYLPLEKGAKVWAEKAASLLPSVRIDSYDKMANAGYDIRKEAVKLNEFYKRVAYEQ